MTGVLYGLTLGKTSHIDVSKVSIRVNCNTVSKLTMCVRNEVR